MTISFAHLCEWTWALEFKSVAAASLVAAVFSIWFLLRRGAFVYESQSHAANQGLRYFLKYNFALVAVGIACWFGWIRELSSSENDADPDDKPFSPSTADAKQMADAQTFYGYDSNGNWIIARIEQYLGNDAVSWLRVYITGIGLFETHDHSDSISPKSHSKEFQAKYLQFELLESHRRWRISFNGPLRKTSNSNTSSVPDGNECYENVSHVKFVFIWEALTSLYFPEHDISIHNRASTFASTTLTESIRHAFCKTQEHVSYAQVGGIHGVLQIDCGQPLNLKLQSTRYRCTGPDAHGRNGIFQLVALEDGTTVLLITFKNTDTTHRLISGCLFNPNTEKRLIDYHITDWHQSSERPLMTESLLQFWSGDRQYSLLTHCIDHTIVNNCEECGGLTSISIMSVTCSDCKGIGITEVARWSKPRHASSSRERKLASMISDGHNMLGGNGELVLALGDELCSVPHVVGGKACNLSLLSQLQQEENFIVPSALCLTVNAFSRHLAADEHLQRMILRMQKEALHCQERECANSLQEICQDISSYIRSSTLSSYLLNLLSEKISLTFGHSLDGLLFAVRSSAVGEDTLESSYAGQLETILAVKGDVLDIEKAILSCWASQFSFRAVQYKRQLGQNLSGAMGVLIQKMAPCEFSGVLFTREPITGNPSVMTIHWASGIGEAVMSGHADPDTITVSRSAIDKCDILKKHSGTSKSLVIESGNELENTDPNITRLALSDDIVLRICDIGIELEKQFGYPTDIEWTVHGDFIYLLQARPVTTLSQPDEHEIVHEFDSPRSKDDEFWTLCNIGEILPSALTPLTITTSLRAMEKGAQDVSEQCNGYKSTPYGHMFFKLSYGRPFINLHFLEMSNENRCYALNRRILELSFLGQVLPTMSDEEVNSYNRPLPAWWKMLNVFKFVQCIRKAEATLTRWDRTIDSYTVTQATDAVQIYCDICLKLKDLDEVWAAGYPCSMKSMAGAQIISVLLAPGSKKYSPDVCHDMARLLSACGNVISATVPSMIENIAAYVRQHEMYHDFVKLTPTAAAEWLLSAESGEIGSLFKEFLFRHGHRAAREIELIERSWAQEPEKCASVIQQTALRKTTESKRKDINNADALIRQLKTPLSFVTRKLVGLFLPSAWSGVSRREWSKSLQVKMNDKFKQAYWMLARAMQREGRIPEEQLLFFFTHEEIGRLIRSRSAALVLRAQKRKKLYAHIEQLDFSRDHRQIPKPVACATFAQRTYIVISHAPPTKVGRCGEQVIRRSNDERQATWLPGPQILQATDSNEQAILRLTGTAASLGKVRGRTRVLTSLEAARTIQIGDILIVRSTDIGWSPYFPMISGLVTEIGGVMSHGAVIAREYGIPCLVNCHGVVSSFKTGDFVEVCCETGEIRKMECFAECTTKDTLLKINS